MDIYTDRHTDREADGWRDQWLFWKSNSEFIWYFDFAWSEENSTQDINRVTFSLYINMLPCILESPLCPLLAIATLIQ